MASSVELYLEGDSVVVEDDYVARSERSDDEEAELSWRLDPEKSLADWTVLIATEHETTPYHIHKSVLAIGPRRSAFFAHAFQGKHSGQSSTGGNHSDCMSDCGGLLPIATYTDVSRETTRIELEEIAANAIPECLDYIYSNSGELDISTENACALHYLSYALEIKSLRRKVREFWINDLDMANLPLYYKHACIFKDENILEYAEEYCAEHIFGVEEEIVVKLLIVIDPEFFLRVILASGGSSLRLSLLVAVYCNLHKTELDQDIFLRLTDAKHIPHLEVKAALVLLEIEDQIRNNSSEITSLKERSIEVLSKFWQDCVSNGKVTMPRLTGKALEAFVVKSFLSADATLHEAKQLSNNDELVRIMKSHASLERELLVAKEEISRLERENHQLRKDIIGQNEFHKEEKKLLQQKLDVTRNQLDSSREQLKLRRSKISARSTGNESSDKVSLQPPHENGENPTSKISSESETRVVGQTLEEKKEADPLLDNI